MEAAKFSLLGAAFDFAEVGEGAVEFGFVLADAEEGFDAGDEFELVDGFGEEVVGAGFDAAFDVAEFVEGGDHEDGDVAGFGVGLEAAADFEAGHAGHHDVEEDEVGFDLGDFFQSVDAVDGDVEGAVEGFEVGEEEFDVLGDVVDDEDGGGGELGFVGGRGGSGGSHGGSPARVGRLYHAMGGDARRRGGGRALRCKGAAMMGARGAVQASASQVGGGGRGCAGQWRSLGSGGGVVAEVVDEEFFIVEAGLFTLGEAVVADADFVGANFGAGGATVGHGGSPKGGWRRVGPFPSQGFQTADWQKGMQ